jgi:hypothetical protein
VKQRLVSVATTAASSAKVAVVDSGEVGRSAVYDRYNNGPRTLPWRTPALTEDSSVYLVSTLMKKNGIYSMWKEGGGGG